MELVSNMLVPALSLLVATLLFLVAPDRTGCHVCECPPLDLKMAFANADVVVLGRVMALQIDRETETVRVDVDVSEALKSSGSSALQFFTGTGLRGNCSVYDFRLGTEYLIFSMDHGRSVRRL